MDSNSITSDKFEDRFLHTINRSEGCFKRVIVPIDFSAGSRLAHLHALKEARADDQLHLLHVLPVRNMIMNPNEHTIDIYNNKISEYDREEMKSKSLMTQFALNKFGDYIHLCNQMNRNCTVSIRPEEPFVQEIQGHMLIDPEVRRSDVIANTILNFQETLNADEIILSNHSLADLSAEYFRRQNIHRSGTIFKSVIPVANERLVYRMGSVVSAVCNLAPCNVSVIKPDSEQVHKLFSRNA
jgi:nucleotide-binding universal stress UspA family protein